MGMVEEVRIAKRTGFCYGVREAIDKAKEASAAGKATHTLGQVVHNEGVVRDLQDLGIQSVETLDDVDHGAAVVIRAHGVRPDVMHRAEERGLEVIDGTCTWVIQEQKELARLVEEGYTIVLLGTPKHPEVVGLLGFAPDAIVVDEEEEWDAAIHLVERVDSLDPEPLEVGDDALVVDDLAEGMGRLARRTGLLRLVNRLAHAVAKAGALGDPDLGD